MTSNPICNRNDIVPNISEAIVCQQRLSNSCACSAAFMDRGQELRAPRARSLSPVWMRVERICLVTLFTVTVYREEFLPYIDFIAFPGEMFALSVVCSSLRGPITALYIYQTRAIHRMRQQELYDMYALLTNLLHDPLHMGGSMFHIWRTRWTEDDAILFHTRLQAIARILTYYFPGLVDPIVNRWNTILLENASFPLAQTDIPDQYRSSRSFYLRALSFMFSRQYDPTRTHIWYQHALYNQRMELELAMRASVGFLRTRGLGVSHQRLLDNSQQLARYIPASHHRLRVSVDFLDDVDGAGHSYTSFFALDRLIERFPWVAVGSVRGMTRLHHGFRYPFWSGT